MKRRTALYLTGALAAVLVAVAVSLAAVPQTINFQGYLADSGGTPVNGTVQMQFKLYSSQSVTATPLWSETHQSVQVADGRYSVVLGNGSPTPVPINLPFDMPYYLGIKVGSDAEMTPRLALTSMGYAFRAAQADSINSQTTITATNAIVSTVPTGMAPLQVTSTTMVPNLNVEMVGGMHATDFVAKTGDSMTGSLAVSASTGNAVTGSTTGSGSAGYFEINNASNSSIALQATTNGSGPAVYGLNTGSGNGVSGTASGTAGRGGWFRIINAANTADAVGAITTGTGNAISGSTTGSGSAGYFEINNASNSSIALQATTNGGGPAVYGLNTGSGNAISGAAMGTAGRAGWFRITNPDNTSDVVGATTSGTGYSGYFKGGAGVLVDGALNVTGTKNFVQPHPIDPGKQIAYVAMEGPESAVFVRGTARLVNGKAIIETSEDFRMVAADKDITVQFTPRSSDTFGLAAIRVTKDRIEVEELKGEKHSYEFDYFITGKRAGYGEHNPIQRNDKFTADNMTVKEFEQTYAKTESMNSRAIRALLISNGILTSDGKLNMETARKLAWKIKEDKQANEEARR